ncbi:MAG TPA: ATP-binding protein [Polyangiales bacterium]|nr:ATP-binding protein [Polyangiales bacterium]
MARTHLKSQDGDDESRQANLREAQEALEALRAGEVDAVLVDRPKGQQSYTFEGPDKPFRVFVEHMHEGAVTIDPQGLVLYSNRCFAQMVGVPLSELLGTTLERFVAPSALDTFRASMREAAVRPVHADCSLQAADGRAIASQVAIAALPSLEEPMLGVVFTDLSERERANELQIARTRALADNAARDQFLAVVSHELRTPLHAILGWVQMLTESETDGTVQKGLRVIERNARAQAQLIDDLLDVSRIIAGKLRLEVERVDVMDIAEAALGSVRPAAAAKDISITVSGKVPETPLNADPQRLQQIIWNLLSNAVKYTQRGGAVALQLGTCDDHLQIEVIDNGRGIGPEFLPHVWSRFSQADSSFARASGGLGLGLSIVKHLAEMHGGTVSAHSDGLHCGSRFTVQLPLSAAGKQHHGGMGKSGKKPEEETGVLRELKVLLVEDEPDGRELLSLLLERRGASVHAADNAAEALDLLASNSFDVMISDIGLPGMDGYGLIRQVRARGLGPRELPAVALTAFARAEDRRLALSAGFQSHVSKPVDASELSTVIASLTGRVT